MSVNSICIVESFSYLDKLWTLLFIYKRQNLFVLFFSPFSLTFLFILNIFLLKRGKLHYFQMHVLYFLMFLISINKFNKVYFWIWYIYIYIYIYILSSQFKYISNIHLRSDAFNINRKIYLNFLTLSISFSKKLVLTYVWITFKRNYQWLIIIIYHNRNYFMINLKYYVFFSWDKEQKPKEQKRIKKQA